MASDTLTHTVSANWFTWVGNVALIKRSTYYDYCIAEDPYGDVEPPNVFIVKGKSRTIKFTRVWETEDNDYTKYVSADGKFRIVLIED